MSWSSLRRSRLLASVLWSAAALGQASAQAHWTVDDDGPADFASLAAAVASPLVKNHDVLRVAPGTYASFKTSKTLRVVARGDAARPRILGGETIFEPALGPLVLAGLEIQELRCGHVGAPVVIEDCEIGHVENVPVGTSFESGYFTFYLESCAAVVSNVTALGQKSAVNSSLASPALAVRNGTFAVVNGTLAGGPGGVAAGCAAPGKAAIHFENAGALVVAGCTLKGGKGGGTSGLCTQNLSDGGPSLRVMADYAWYTGPAVASVRGSSWHLLDPGEPNGAGDEAPSVGGTGGQVSLSGVSVEAPAFGELVTGTLIDPPEPYLTLTSDGVPGGQALLSIYGPPGASATVGIATSGSPSAPAHVVGGPLWLEPASVVASFHVTTLGQELPVVRSFRLPESQAFAGSVFWVQAFFPVGDGTLHATNPATVVPRF